ncbi:MAG: tRNA (5-methylaminomethyl-2-thiouridine)(34)-methyltransferase MnmD, partial [Amphiplicatus sp.]
MTGEASKLESRIVSAQVDWDANAPRSIFFGDIYFSGDGEAEAGHVFLKGNALEARFAGAARFSIGELGFGTGLNFLTTWALWRRAAGPRARLRYFSVERFPLDAADLARAHRAWPGLQDLAARLRAALPPPARGLHQIDMAEDVTLLLGLGEAGDILARAEGPVDAWFFDGFSPAKNPDMWRTALFEEAARLSAPTATFATFTVAGDVRRALAAAGFAAEKCPGFGRKREMLCGRIERRPARSPRASWFQPAGGGPLAPGARLAIIGGGIAGASLAREARRAGLRPTIFDPEGLAAGASGNRAGLVMPRLDLGGGAGARFFVLSYLHTIRLLSSLSKDPSEKDLFIACGVLL